MFWLWLGVNALAALLLALEAVNLVEFPLLRGLPCDEPVDAIVAMRNEQENAAAFLDAALAAPVARVIVVDDSSADETLAAIESRARGDERVVVRRAAGEGKSAALAQGAAAAVSPWLLFLDADVRIGPGAPGALVAFARERGAAAATAWPRVAIPSPAALLFSPLVTLFLMQLLPMRLARTPNPNATAGNGQCFLVRADAYAACGGHAAIETVVEDVALARAIKRAGFGVALASGAAIATVKGYAAWGDALRGYARSLYFGAGAAGVLATLTWLTVLLLSPLPLYLARLLSAARMRESAASVALAPAGVLCGAIAAVYAIVGGTGRRLTWRGRTLRG